VPRLRNEEVDEQVRGRGRRLKFAGNSEGREVVPKSNEAKGIFFPRSHTTIVITINLICYAILGCLSSASSIVGAQRNLAKYAFILSSPPNSIGAISHGIHNCGLIIGVDQPASDSGRTITYSRVSRRIINKKLKSANRMNKTFSFIPRSLQSVIRVVQIVKSRTFYACQ
jgi:hypothetical protein